jgi:N-acetylmuramoyl-L-alanine amidase
MYVVGNISEQESCRKIAAELKVVLDKCGFTTYAGMTGSMYTRAAESNDKNVDLHMPIHTNACNGMVSGLRIMVSKKGGEAEKIAKAIMDTLAPITPGTSDGISVMSNLYEIKATKAICVYLEVGFHDNAEEAQWIIDHPKDIAVAIAKGLCNYYGVAYKNDTAVAKPVAPTPEKTEVKLNLGDVITLVKGAKYTNGKSCADFLYNSTLYVRGIDGDKITFSIYKSGAITGAINKKYVLKGGKPVTSTSTVTEKPMDNFEVGDVISLVKGAKYTNGKTCADFLYSRTLYVRAVNGDKITFSIYKTGAITGTINKKYVQKK